MKTFPLVPSPLRSHIHSFQPFPFNPEDPHSGPPTQLALFFFPIILFGVFYDMSLLLLRVQKIAGFLF